LLRLWVTTGSDFTKTIHGKVTRQQLDSALGHHEQVVDLPSHEVPSPDWNLINALIKKGVSITAVAQGSNFLSVSFISVPKDASKLLTELIPVHQNIIGMKLSDCAVGDESMSSVKQFNNLMRLSLDNTKITDVGLTAVSTLSELVSLNLKGAPVSADGIRKLSRLNKLHHLYLYQTKIANIDRQELQSIFKTTQIDFGDYKVPTLTSDTTEVKPPKH